MVDGTSISSSGQYSAEGWVQWPDYPEKSFNFIRVLAVATEGGSSVGEAMLVGSRIDPQDDDSWHREWHDIADVNLARATEAVSLCHYETARVNFLRAANYYRSAEYFLGHDDPRRMVTFDKVEAASREYMKLMQPVGEVVQIAFEDSYLDAYFLRAPGATAKQPVIICFGGLDEYKDELLHEMPRHAFPRGLSLLLVDLPGQGGSIRRRNLRVRLDMEKPVGACVDYLVSRGDVDSRRIALYGASLGGFYAPRAASFEHRLACVVSDGAIWNALANADALRQRHIADPNSLVVRQLMWIAGVSDMEAAIAHFADFKLEGTIHQIKCPYLIVHGEHDFAGMEPALDSYEYAKANGLDVTLRVFKASETGAAHCQMDNPCLGQEFICDWIADKLEIQQK